MARVLIRVFVCVAANNPFYHFSKTNSGYTKNPTHGVCKVEDVVFCVMDPNVPADDNKYTIGIAAFTCLLPLPIMYFVSLPVILTRQAPWTPWLPVLLLMLTPPLTAFTILYHGPWQLNWSRPKRVLLGIPLSLMIAAAGVALISTFIFPFFVVCCLVFPNLVSY
jgi:hypothetical protein